MVQAAIRLGLRIRRPIQPFDLWKGRPSGRGQAHREPVRPVLSESHPQRQLAPQRELALQREVAEPDPEPDPEPDQAQGMAQARRPDRGWGLEWSQGWG